MNIKNILAILAIMFLHLSAQAQIKKQFQDSSDELTTVVIKEENENDLDILNEQFDLDEMGMHQVVRITTGGEVVVDGPKPQTPEQAPNVAPVEQEIIVARAPEVKKIPQKKKVEKKTVKKTKESVESNTGGASVSNTSTVKSSNRRTAFKPHYSKKRFKKKKRKKRSRRSKRRGSCYRF